MTIGKAMPMHDSVARVTGTMPYAITWQPADMLIAKVLRSPLPHARLVGLDASRAKQLPGVVAVLTAADLGQPDGPGETYGLIVEHQPVVAGERVRYVGEPVALVAAETAEIAEAALELIEVEYEELPAVITIEAAQADDSPILHDDYLTNCLRHTKIRHGDLAAGFAAADLIIEETYTSPVANYAALEPHITMAQWDNGQLTIWTTTQAPYVVRRSIATLFGLDEASVRIIVPPLGGGYGGKGHIRLEPMVAALAWKVNGRPVKLTATRAEEFITVTKHAGTITLKSGLTRDGRFTARQITACWNVGAYADLSAETVGAGMLRAVGPYRCPAVHVDSYGYFTNLPSAAAFRGAMSSQGTWAYESHIDTVAQQLGLDPLAFRRQNLLIDGDTFATGEPMHDVHFVECLNTCAKRLGWDKSKPASHSKALKYGRGLAVMMKNTIPNSRSECRLVLNDQGQLTLFTSTVEMGQGAHTALAQIAAKATGVPFERVSVVGPDTAQSPYDTTTSAARSTGMMGPAIMNGAAKLKEKLKEATVSLLEHRTEELSAEDGWVFVTANPGQRMTYAEILGRHRVQTLAADGEYQTHEQGLDPETGQGVSAPHWHQGAGACEITVDTETGRVTLLRYYAASFAGKTINPQLAKLQNDGNVIFGLGPAVLEEVLFEDGQVVNGNAADYKIPAILDIPAELHSVSLETDHSEIHGIGEMTLPPVAPAIANAIYDAVGVRIYDLPLTAERILRAIKNEQ